MDGERERERERGKRKKRGRKKRVGKEVSEARRNKEDGEEE